VLPELAPHFEQVVLLGYPPFVKDVVDTGLAAGFDWSRHTVKLVLAGEVFSEEWRDLMAERAGLGDPTRDSVSLYGTADAGVLGNETPLSVTIRRFLAARPELARELFGDSRLPTLVQYDPGSRYFESHDGTLLFSGENGIPLIRYPHRRRRRNRSLPRYAGLLCPRRVRPAHGRRRGRPPAAVRFRLRALVVHGVVLRRQHLPGERDGRA
jgi:phenylacetate-coenzyme A ligase PaaK-like adenylate-forming protein